jgi:hypothetical protein
VNTLAEGRPASPLVKLLFPLPALQRTPLAVFSWWESRRLVYNAIVGITGVFTLGIVTLTGLAFGMPITVPWQIVVLYGACANLVYTAGPVIEAVSVKLWREDVAPIGPTLFRYGLVFSVGLTLFPIALAGIGTVVSKLLPLFR